MSGLPEGWTWATPHDVAAQIPNAITIGPFGSDLKVADYRATGVPLVFVREIRARQFGDERTKYIELEKAASLKRHYVRPGDVLITKMGDPPGDTALYPSNRPPAIITADCIKLTPNPSITTPDYLVNCLRSDIVRGQILERAAGVAQQKISLERFRTIQIPLAPLPEQKRIADKLDTLLARVDTCRNHLARVPAILKRFRQSVLVAATSGKLSEEWRRNGNPSVSYRSLPIDDDSIEIPDHWAESTLIESIDPQRPLCYGVVQPGDHDPNGVSLIRVQDMVNRAVAIEQLRTVSQDVDSEYQRSRVRAGDLLISVVGTIGRTSIVPHGLQANIARAVARIACRDGVDARWVDIWISSETIQWWLSRNAREVARKTLNLSELSMVPIAVPPLDEQAEIVRRVESLFALADQLEARYTTARTHIDRLTPALLAKAFRGELVPQDPGDAP